IDGLPELVRAAPRADDQEVEIVLAAMQHDEPDVAVEFQPTGLRLGNEIVARQRADRFGHRRRGASEIVPFEARAPELEQRVWRHELRPVAIGGIDMLQARARARTAVIRHRTLLALRQW